jgi:hypothetical protein
MEEDWKPFEVRVTGERKTLCLQGTEESLVKIEADKSGKILEAIKRGWNVYVEWADIDGDISIGEIADDLEKNNYNRWIITGNINMRGCMFRANVNFGIAHFSGDTFFEFAHFSRDAYFESAHFSRVAYFESAHFSRDVSFEFAHFGGNASFGYAQFSKYADFGYAHFNGDVRFQFAQFSGGTNFGLAQFSGDADFGYARFSSSAYFSVAQFSKNAYFNSAEFSRDADFSSVKLNGDANFKNAVVARPAGFGNVTFRENHVFKGLWNTTLGRIKRLHWQITDFSGFNTEKVMDGASNPWLKRYIDDELWIQSWRERSWWRKTLFIIWELTSHCGRSIGLWAFWSVLIAFIFGFLHKGHIEVGSVNNWYTPFYFSVVTFTTLGFGDVTAKDGLGQFWITLEVVLGYVMLGGLISIFANKLARRS